MASKAVESLLESKPDDSEAISDIDPDKVIESLFEKKNGRPVSAWNQLRASFPQFARKPLSAKAETLKGIAATIAYFREQRL